MYRDEGKKKQHLYGVVLVLQTHNSKLYVRNNSFYIFLSSKKRFLIMRCICEMLNVIKSTPYNLYSKK